MASQAVRALAEQVAAQGRLSVLLNNVGAMFDDRRVRPEGVEATFALNHLSAHLLTQRLLPSLLAGAPSRVVNVTFGSIRIGTRRFSAAEAPGGYHGVHASGRAKFASLVHTIDVAEQLRDTGISVYAADPGAAVTDMTTGTVRSSQIVTSWLRPLAARTAGIPVRQPATRHDRAKAGPRCSAPQRATRPLEGN